MTNLERNHIQPEQIEKKTKAQIVAEQIVTICEELEGDTDHQRRKELQDEILHLVRENAQGTDFLVTAVEQDLKRYGNGSAVMTFSTLPDHLEIDLREKSFGIFTPEGARKFEANQLNNLLPVRGDSDRLYHTERQQRQFLFAAWAPAFAEFYDRPHGYDQDSGFDPRQKIQPGKVIYPK